MPRRFQFSLAMLDSKVPTTWTVTIGAAVGLLATMSIETCIGWMPLKPSLILMGVETVVCAVLFWAVDKLLQHHASRQ